ncbi:translation initiation factor IF-2, partial [Streptomyces sp. PAL114]|nr:translation initiation factor IF-2 [Streptomyces sp. PAL114]
MRRLLLLAPVLLALAGCGVMQSSEDEATDSAREVATTAGKRLASQLPRTADEVGYSASNQDGVEVLRVEGDSTHDGDGVEVIVRTSGSAYDGWFDVEQVTVRRCFSLRVSPRAEWGEEARDVDCPEG